MNVNNFFDKIYCINLTRRPDRWERCSKQFSNNEIQVERFNAIDKLDLPIVADNSTLAGEIACKLSHLKLIELAKANNLKNILIFEDDIVISQEFNNIFRSNVKNIPNNWAMLYLGGSHLGGLSHIQNNIFKIYHTYTTHAYSINSNMYDLLIDHVKKSDRPIDVAYAEIHRNYPCYLLRGDNGQLIWQEEGTSDITGATEFYNWLL